MNIPSAHSFDRAKFVWSCRFERSADHAKPLAGLLAAGGPSGAFETRHAEEIRGSPTVGKKFEIRQRLPCAARWIPYRRKLFSFHRAVGERILPYLHQLLPSAFLQPIRFIATQFDVHIPRPRCRPIILPLADVIDAAASRNCGFRPLKSGPDWRPTSLCAR